MTPIELASEFAKLGYYVFPLIKSIKGPHVKPFGWARNTVHDPTKADILIPATNDLTEIETWPLRVKRGYKSTIAGFGITGFGCVILDLDVKGGKNGIAEFAEMIKDYGIPKTPMMTISKSGGLHLFYAKPAKYAEDYVKTLSGVKIETDELLMRVDLGEYIIQGIENEIYPCKANVFEQSYDFLPDAECP